LPQDDGFGAVNACADAQVPNRDEGDAAPGTGLPPLALGALPAASVGARMVVLCSKPHAVARAAVAASVRIFKKLFSIAGLQIGVPAHDCVRSDSPKGLKG
jgi:hypothetical protein